MGRMSLHLRNAVAGDGHDIRLALRAAGLPVEGLDAQLNGFFICETGGAFHGAAGLEVHGEDGLLRSVVVAPDKQHRGIGRRLCERVMDHARGQGCRAVYLLTLDAAGYFERLGFETIGRDQAPEGIRASREFSVLCPGSAVLMRRKIAS